MKADAVIALAYGLVAGVLTYVVAREIQVVHDGHVLIGEIEQMLGEVVK